LFHAIVPNISPSPIGSFFSISLFQATYATPVLMKSPKQQQEIDRKATEND
jgi:hypothetical protein